MVTAGPGHALRFEPEASGGLRPYLHVRRDLWAKVAPPIIARAQRIRDRQTRDAIRALYVGVFKTANIAQGLGLDEKEVFGQLAYDLQCEWLSLEIVDGKAVAWKRPGL